LINGVDDLLAEWGPDRALDLFANAESSEKQNVTQAQILIRLAEGAELFHSPSGEGCARFLVDQHSEVWPLRSSGFRNWLVRQFYAQAKKPPSTQALQDAIGLLAARAQFDGPERPLAVRVAEHDGKIYIDLCNSLWQVVEIDGGDWRVVDRSPVRFRRASGMHPLPIPTRGGSITQLRKFINVGDDANWIMCVCWLLAACRPRGPYPVLLLQGEQGSAKSTMGKLLRRLVDPSVSLIRTAPREERDLLIAATNSWVVAYDNLSGIPPWLSDALCRLATGGGFSIRALYTDSDEIFFNAMRPVALNGIDQLAERADLADRSLILNLPRIDNSARMDEAKLYEQFELELPQILGALYTVLSSGLARLPNVSLASKPRMADFAMWATASEPGLGLEPGAFMKVYEGNRTEAVRETLDNDPVATPLIKFLDQLHDEGNDLWEGSCGELHQRLDSLVDERVKRSRQWPDSARGLSGRLRRLVTFLREVGIIITFNPKGAKGLRTLTIERKQAQ
jgi:hypothetical protein